MSLHAVFRGVPSLACFVFGFLDPAERGHAPLTPKLQARRSTAAFTWNLTVGLCSPPWTGAAQSPAEDASRALGLETRPYYLPAAQENVLQAVSGFPTRGSTALPFAGFAAYSRFLSLVHCSFAPQSLQRLGRKLALSRRQRHLAKS